MNNMRTIKLDDYEIFKNNKSTLKVLSIDSEHNEYMTESGITAVDFDSVKAEYEAELNLPPDPDGYASSVDAIVNLDDSIVFIEFKNGKMNNEKRTVKTKIRDSLLIFGAITDENITYTSKNAEFVLVYNIEKNPIPNQMTKPDKTEYSDKSRTEIAKLLHKKAGTEFVRFGIEKFKKLYFKDVHTFSKDEFEDYLNNH